VLTGTQALSSERVDSGSAPVVGAALEKHYRVGDIAKLWGFCRNTIIRIFRDEPGVVRLEGLPGKRKYVTLSLPASVALRVHERLSHQPLKTELPARNPRCIIRLRDLNRGVT
jgi:hypothetical protein